MDRGVIVVLDFAQLQEATAEHRDSLASVQHDEREIMSRDDLLFAGLGRLVNQQVDNDVAQRRLQ